MNITSFNYKFVAAQKPNSDKLMIVLHGVGDSFNGYYWLPRELDIPELNYLLLNAPDEYYDGYSWYDLSEDRGESFQQGRKEADIKRSLNLLFDLFIELERDGWQSENIFLLGFSQGCLMSLEVGLNYSKQLAGICAISGYLANKQITKAQINPQAFKQNWLITHGAYDEIISLEAALKGVNILKSFGLPIDFHSFDKTHTIDAYEELPLIQSWLKKLIE